MRVLLLAAHGTSGRSMQRYTDLLVRAYTEIGVRVRVLRAPEYLSSRVPARARKWAGYVEKFVLFWPSVWWHSASADLVHVPDHSDAIWVLGVRRRPVLVTCHDLFAVRAALGELPEHRPGRTGRGYQRLVLAGLRGATCVVSVSDSTAADVERLTGQPRRRLYNPTDDRIAHNGTPPALPWRDYLLAVSTRGWRKRRHASVHAWTKLRQTEPLRGCGLVVVGDPLGPEELEIAEKAEATGNVVQLDRISDAELSALYSAAQGLVHLSRYEGFGWPIVEAQTHRTPVLVSDADIFREVAGEHACFVKDEDLEHSAHAIWEAMANRLTAVDLEMAAQQTERFGWRTFVDSLSEIAHGLCGVAQPAILDDAESTTETSR